MAAIRLEDDGDGLELNPNFELLALLLALALQEGDAEGFLEVYDHNVPKSLSAVEVEGLKDQARELSDLPVECLLELKAAQEREVITLSSSSEKYLGHFVSRSVSNSHTLRADDTRHSDPCRGGSRFQSRFGSLLSSRLNASLRNNGGCGDASENQGTLNLQNDFRNHSNVGSQAGTSYVCQQETFIPPLDEQAFFESYCDLLATGDRHSNLVQSQWSTMESTTAHNKLQRTQTGSVKHNKKPSIHKNPAACLQEQLCMNGSVHNVNIRTSKCAEEETHGIKSKPPQKELLCLEKSKTVPKSTRRSSHPENFHSDNCIHGDDFDNDKIAAFITKSPTVPNSPPFKSFEEVGQSVGKLLENSHPRNSTSPPLMYRSMATKRLRPNSVSSSMASTARTQYGKIPDTETSVSKDDLHKVEQVGLTRPDAHINHQLPINTSEDSKNTQSKSFSTPKVPSNVNISTVNASRDEVHDGQDKDLDGEEKPKDINSQWAAAKKKKKKNKNKKPAASSFEAVSTNNIKLPVGLQSLDLRTKDSCSAGTTASKLTNQSSSDLSRHPPPMVSSDSVTSSGESSTDGGACVNDTSSHHATSAKKNPSVNYVDHIAKNTSVTSSIDNAFTGSGAGQNVITSSKLHHNHEKCSTNHQYGAATLETDRRFKPGNRRQNPPSLKPAIRKLSQSRSVRSDPSDSDSDRYDTKSPVDKDMVSWQTTVAGKPHSLSEPTASADSSVDKDDTNDFIKVEYKRSQRSAKKRGGAMDDHKYGPYPGRYIDRDRDYFRNRNMLSAGLRKSSSEPSGMSELGDKDTEEVHSYKTKSKGFSDNIGKPDTNLANPGQSEPSAVPQSDFSYASKVKCNMKTSSLPLKLTPQALLDYVDDDHSDNPDNSETSPEYANVSKFPAFECKTRPSGKSVLAKNGTVAAEKTETNTTHIGREQPVKNNFRPEKFVSLTSKPLDNSRKLGPGRSFQRSSSIDTSEVTKKVSFDDNLIRRSSPPRQGPEARMQYLDVDFTYAGRLKVQRPTGSVHRPLAISQQLLTSDAPKTSSLAGPRDHTLQPLGHKQNEKERLLTSRASIVLAKNRPNPNNVAVESSPATKPVSTNPTPTAGFKPIHQPLPTQHKITPTALPASLTRNIVTSPTPSASSSTSKPHPTFDLEPQDNFDITFGSVIVGKAGYEILAEDTAAAAAAAAAAAVKRSSPIKELLSKIQVPDQVSSPPGLSCAELEKTFMNQEPRQTTSKPSGKKSPSPGDSGFRRVDGAWELAASAKDDDGLWDFNHVELAEMLLAEWHKTQAEIGQKKVLIEG